jgi:multicomponent K+:H+ antiporter subunit D
VISGLAGTIALMRFGVRTFWAVDISTPPHLRPSEVAPVFALLILCVLMTVGAGPLTRYLDRTAASLHTPQLYIDRVLSQGAVIGRGAVQ